VILLLLAAAVTDSSVTAVTAQYDHLCVHSGPTAAAILGAADREGWSSTMVRAPKDFDPAHKRWKQAVDGPVVLSAYQNSAGGDVFVSCGIAVSAARPRLDAAVGAMTGVTPAVTFPNASTRLTIRANGRWRDPAAMPRADFAAAKAAGEVYSIMTTTAPDRAALFSLNILPAATAMP
jgi:hypothetical protein